LESIDSRQHHSRDSTYVLILNADDIRRALPMQEAIVAMKRAFAALEQDQAIVPLRIHIPVPEHEGVTLIMPAFLRDPESPSLIVKVASIFDPNPDRNLARIQSVVTVLDPETGCPTAILEGATLIGIRTAAASGAATDFLARTNSRTLAILGSGAQARTHLAAMCAVRDIQEVCVYARNCERLRACVDEMSDWDWCSASIRAVESAAEAIRGADIVCCTTSSPTPIYDDVDLSLGVHVNAVGSYQPHVREVPTATVARATVFVDERESAWEEAGDLIQALEAGDIDRDHVTASLG
jgi:ornithine cyclodeaminase/alanine dehydrogenase-like protein (mu-crystallin family)